MEHPIQRYKLTIAYRGTNYHGWQQQMFSPSWKKERPADGRGMATIQSLVSAALKKVVRHDVVVVGSSRTDAGVHAKGQVAHFDSHMTNIPLEGLRRGANSQLPDDVLIRKIEMASPTFDAIADTERKRYQYVVWNTPDRPPFMGDLVFHRWQKLDLTSMQRAAAHLVGTHDFNAFAKPGHGRTNTVRTIHECSVSARGPRVVIGVTGSGFLWNMVRIIAGTIIEIGIGRMRHLTADAVPEMLQSRDRRRSGATAPAQGLYLHWITYKEERGERKEEREDQSPS
ncbi:MAG TPA: tRNA pseudouridine(38-40) synthase TruA [Tepidisphaeraceae bacterium]